MSRGHTKKAVSFVFEKEKERAEVANSASCLQWRKVARTSAKERGREEEEEEKDCREREVR